MGATRRSVLLVLLDGLEGPLGESLFSASGLPRSSAAAVVAKRLQRLLPASVEQQPYATLPLRFPLLLLLRG